MSIEHGGPSPEEMGLSQETTESKLPPEALDAMTDYWEEQQTKFIGQMADGSGRNFDVDISRTNAYLEKIDQADYFTPAEVKKTVDGKEVTSPERSVFDFFKKKLAGLEYAIEQGDDLKTIQEYEKQAKQMRMAVEALEKIRPKDSE